MRLDRLERHRRGAAHANGRGQDSGDGGDGPARPARPRGGDDEPPRCRSGVVELEVTSTDGFSAGAAFVGVLTARASGAFDRLPDLDADELTSLLLELLPPRH